MFLGHFAMAFAAKMAAPRVSLGTLFIGAQLADLAWPVFVLAGVESLEVHPGITAVTPLDFTHYPYSHSLVALLAWALALAVAHWAIRRGRLADAVILAALVLSHWVLDVASHRPDMPVTLHGAERLGFSLWNSVPATMFVEGALLLAGVLAYTRFTRARDRTGSLAFWSLIAFLVLVYLGSVFGPPPPSAIAVAWSAMAVWLLVAWGYWIDRHRDVIADVAAGGRQA